MDEEGPRCDIVEVEGAVRPEGEDNVFQLLVFDLAAVALGSATPPATEEAATEVARIV